MDSGAADLDHRFPKGKPAIFLSSKMGTTQDVMKNHGWVGWANESQEIIWWEYSILSFHFTWLPSVSNRKSSWRSQKSWNLLNRFKLSLRSPHTRSHFRYYSSQSSDKIILSFHLARVRWLGFERSCSYWHWDHYECADWACTVRLYPSRQ